jgi:hypothetical protein
MWRHVDVRRGQPDFFGTLDEVRLFSGIRFP